MATVKERLTRKEKGFVKDYGGLGTGSATVKKHYDVSTDETARAIAHENLTKPHIIKALDDRGFNEENAKNVVVEIMEDKTKDPNARLKATDQVFKVEGSYAPEKSVNLNIEVPSEKQRIASEAITRFLNEHRSDITK